MSRKESPPSPPRRLTVPGRHIARLAALSAQHPSAGPGDPPRLAAESRDGGVGLADYFRLLKALAEAAGQETFQLSARPLRAGTADFVFSRAQLSATLGDAMREIATAYNFLHGDAYNRVERLGGLIVYELDDETFPYACPRDDFLVFSLECTLLFLHAALCELADADLTPLTRRVQTRGTAEDEEAPSAVAFWNVPVARAAPVYSIAYDASVAGLPVRRRNRHMPLHMAVHNRILDLLQDRESRVAEPRGVEAAVDRALRDGLHDQSEIAARLGVSVATLRRRLAPNGGFRALRQRVMTEKARARLSETGDVADTAEALGFSDRRSFARAFKALTGETPGAYVARCRARQPPSATFSTNPTVRGWDSSTGTAAPGSKTLLSVDAET